MNIFQNIPNDLAISYLANAALFITTGLTLFVHARSNKQNRESSREIEILKSRIQLNSEYQKEKLGHIRQLLNYIYNIRVSAADLRRKGFNTENVVTLTSVVDDFEKYYRSNADKTSVLDEVVRHYAHEILKYASMVSNYTKHMQRNTSESDFETRFQDLCDKIFELSDIYEKMLRADVKELTEKMVAY